jgi:hypothetical protein
MGLEIVLRKEQNIIFCHIACGSEDCGE